MFLKIFAILLLNLFLLDFSLGSTRLSDDMTDPKDKEWLAQVAAAGPLEPKTLKSITITHDGKEMTFEVRSIRTKKDVAALSKFDREVNGKDSNDEDYRLDKSFGFGAWHTAEKKAPVMVAFLSINDVAPSLRSDVNSLLRNVKDISHDCMEYGWILNFGSQEKYEKSDELDTKLFHEVVKFYAEKYEKKDGQKGKVGIIRINLNDPKPSSTEKKEEERNTAFYKSLRFKHLGQKVVTKLHEAPLSEGHPQKVISSEEEISVMAVTFADLKQIWNKH